MRARYSAFVKRNDTYLRHSWHPDTRPSDLALDRRTRWTGLRVLDAIEGAASDAVGTVEFIASYELDGAAGELHESSRFERLDGRWVYVRELSG